MNSFVQHLKGMAANPVQQPLPCFDDSLLEADYEQLQQNRIQDLIYEVHASFRQLDAIFKQTGSYLLRARIARDVGQGLLSLAVLLPKAQRQAYAKEALEVFEIAEVQHGIAQAHGEVESHVTLLDWRDKVTAYNYAGYPMKARRLLSEKTRLTTAGAAGSVSEVLDNLESMRHRPLFTIV